MPKPKVVRLLFIVVVLVSFLYTASVMYAAVTYYSSFEGGTSEFNQNPRHAYTRHVNPGTVFFLRVDSRSWYVSSTGVNPCKQNVYRVRYNLSSTGNMGISSFNGSFNVSRHEFYRTSPFNETGVFYSSTDNNLYATAQQFNHGNTGGASCGSALVSG